MPDDPDASPSAIGDLDAAALGARLRHLRAAAGLSLSALARALDISPSAVSQIERGVRRPSARVRSSPVTTARPTSLIVPPALRAARTVSREAW